MRSVCDLLACVAGVKRRGGRGGGREFGQKTEDKGSPLRFISFPPPLPPPLYTPATQASDLYYVVITQSSLKLQSD